MSENMTLLEFIRALLFNAEVREDFAEAPEETLEEHGLGDLSPEDVRDALVLINDEEISVESNQSADFGRDYNTGFGGGGGHSTAVPAPAHGESAAEYINRYVTNTYTNDNDTIVDHSINQQIDTRGGDLDQDFDIDSTVASGDGAVAAGGDISGSTITTGNGNQVGNGNVAGDGNVLGDGNQVVSGNGNTTAFGAGDASSTNVGGDLNVGDGAGFANGGDADVDNTSTSIKDSFNDQSDRSVNDSFNDEFNLDVDSSFNRSEEESIRDSFNRNEDASQENVGNVSS